MISKAKKLILLVLLIYASVLVSQEQLKIEKLYTDYFEPLRESIFIHTNKTTFLANEEIWFKTYIINRESSLKSKKTRNFYLGLYDNNGKQIDKKIFLVENGMVSGFFSLDEKLKSGNYYLKGYTNWMKNFEEDDSFILKIKIINSKNKISEENDHAASREYDFQFLPEGGNMLHGVKNTIGFKSINNNGKGIFTEGNIINSKNEIITTFKSNSLGIGKFSFTPIKEETYKANLIIENYKKLSLELPKINDFGVMLNLNNLNSKEVIISLSTNDQSFKKIGNKNYKILVSKDGNLKSFLVKLNTKQKKIVIQRDSLFFGTNTLTIFNDKRKPLSERLFFNGEINTESKLNIEYINIDMDSINFSIENKVLKGKYLSASVSILPKNTVSYNPNHSIYSAFYLKPYVKGNIENPKYYFENFNRKKAYELDLLLLTQGWSKYSWDNIFNNDFKPYFEFEDGITINGSINNKLGKIESLLLYPNSYNNARFISFNKKGKFTLKKYYPVYGEDFKLSIIDKKGNTKPPFLAANSINYIKRDSINAKFLTKKIIKLYSFRFLKWRFRIIRRSSCFIKIK